MLEIKEVDGRNVGNEGSTAGADGMRSWDQKGWHHESTKRGGGSNADVWAAEIR